MTTGDCPHGGDYWSCPPCQNTASGHTPARRLPAWRLIRRNPARYPSHCRACNTGIDPGDRAALWTDGSDGPVTITCPTCHPSGDRRLPVLEEPILPGGNPPCPSCGAALVLDRPRSRYDRRVPAPPRCTACGYTHRTKEPTRG